MNPLKNLLSMLDSGYSVQELDIIKKLEDLFNSLSDEKWIVQKTDRTVNIQNSYCFIMLEKEAQIMKVSFDVRLIPDIVANIALKLRNIPSEMVIMESYMEDTDNNQLIFGQQKINEYLNFRVSAKKAPDTKEEFIN